jgi:allophanate hydrolase subunit 1
MRLFTPETEPPCLLAAGDEVRFVPITREQYDALYRAR